MTTKQDPIIHTLVRKKKELLNQLLALSIQTAIDEQSIDTVAENRAEIVSALNINNEALGSREASTGIKAGQQETGLFKDINSILIAIQDNNAQAVNKLEKEIRDVERERSRLRNGNKLTGYITQQKGYQNRMISNGSQNKRRSESRLLDGTL